MQNNRLVIRVDDELNAQLNELRERGYNVSKLVRMALLKITSELLVTDKQA